MITVAQKIVKNYPWYMRWFFRRQARKYGKVLSPSWLWGRLPLHFGMMLMFLGVYGRKRSPLGNALRALVSARVAQLNGCDFCVDLNSYLWFQATRDTKKVEKVASWRKHAIYTPKEEVALELAEAMNGGPKVKGLESRLKEKFEEDHLIELVAWISFQAMSAKFNSTLNAAENGLCKLPNK